MPAPAQPKATPMQESKPALRWSMKVEGKTLALSIEVENTFDTPIYVCDRLVTNAGNKLVRTDRITVMNDADKPGTVVFALASISPDEPVTTLYTPTFAKVAPGATFEREVVVPYPLVAYHPVAGVAPIAASAREAVVLVHYFASEPTGWKTLEDGGKTPEGHELRVLRSAPRKLP